MGGFIKKFFSSDAIFTRLIRGALAVITALGIMGHMPTNASEWGALLTAFLTGFIGAGQNNSSANPVPPTS